MLFLVGFSLSAESGKIKAGGAYWGEMITHPGISFFFDFPLAENDFTSTSFRIRTGGYIHRTYSQNLFIAPEILYRIYLPSDFYLELEGGGGYLFSRPDTDVYQYDMSTGTFSKTISGFHYFMPIAGINAGRSLVLGDKEIDIFGGLKAFAAYPFNNDWGIHPVFEFGMAGAL